MHFFLLDCNKYDEMKYTILILSKTCNQQRMVLIIPNVLLHLFVLNSFFQNLIFEVGVHNFSKANQAISSKFYMLLLHRSKSNYFSFVTTYFKRLYIYGLDFTEKTCFLHAAFNCKCSICHLFQKENVHMNFKRIKLAA